MINVLEHVEMWAVNIQGGIQGGIQGLGSILQFSWFNMSEIGSTTLPPGQNLDPV